MCMWRAHAVSGVVAGEAVEPLMPRPAGVATVGIFVLVTTVAALVSDLDHPNGKLTHSIPPITSLISWVFVRLSKAAYHATRGPRDHKDTNGHRTVTHTPVFLSLIHI